MTMASKKTPRYLLQSANQNSSDDEPPPAEPGRSRSKGSKRKCEKIVIKVPEICCESRNDSKANTYASNPNRPCCNSHHRSHEHHKCSSKGNRVSIDIKRRPCNKCPCVGVVTPPCQRTHAPQQCNKGHGKAPTQCCHKKLQTGCTRGACVDKCLQTECSNSKKESHKKCQTINFLKHDEKPCTKAQRVQCELMKVQEMSKMKKCKQTSACRNNDEELEENKSGGKDCGHIFPFMSSSEGYLLIHPRMISYENENMCMLTANPCEMAISHKEWCEDNTKVIVRMDHHSRSQPCECQSLQGNPPDVNPFAKKHRSPHSTVHHHRSTNTEAEVLPRNFNFVEDAFSKNVKDTLWTYYKNTPFMENLKALAANFPDEKYDDIERGHHNIHNHNQYDTEETEVNPTTSRRSKKVVYSNDSHPQPFGHHTKTTEYSSVPGVRNVSRREQMNTNNSYSHPQSNSSEGSEDAEDKPLTRTANGSNAKGHIGQSNSNPKSQENEASKERSEMNSASAVRRIKANSEVSKSHRQMSMSKSQPSYAPKIDQRDHQEKSNKKMNPTLTFIDTPPGSESEPQLNTSQESLRQYTNEDIDAAVTLQKSIRGFLSRKTMKERNEAAIKIQRAFRAHLARKARNTEGDLSSNKGREISKVTDSSDMLNTDEVLRSVRKLLFSL